MPNEKTYKVGEDVYDIPENEVSGFLKEFPGAVEVNTFISGKDTFDIPVSEVDGFLKEYPNAKKKVRTPNYQPLVLASASSSAPSNSEFTFGNVQGNRVLPAPTKTTNTPETKSVSIPTIEEATAKAASRLKPETYDMPAAFVVDKAVSKLPQIDRAKAYDKATKNIVARIEPKLQEFNNIKQIVDAGEATPEELKYAHDLYVDIQQEQKKLEIMQKGYEAINVIQSNLTDQEKADAIEKYSGPGGFVKEKMDAIVAGAPAVAGMIAGAVPMGIRMLRVGNAMLPSAANNLVTEEIMNRTGLNNLENSAQDLFKMSNRASEALSAKYDKGIIDSFSSGDLGAASNQATSKFLESLLPSVAAASTGGVGILGFAGQEYYGELKDREDLTEEQKIGLASLKGSLELAFESLGTKAVLNQVSRILSEGGVDAAQKVTKPFIEKVLTDGFGKFTPLTAPVQEFISEYATSLSQSLTDKLIDPTKANLTFSEANKQAFEEGIIGAFGGEVMAAPTIPQMFGSSKNRQQATAIQDQIDKIEAELQKDLPEDVRNVLEDEKQNLLKQINTQVTAENAVVNNLPEEAQQNVNAFKYQLNELENSLPSVSEEVRPVIETKIAQISEQIDNILNNDQQQLTNTAPAGIINPESGETTGISTSPSENKGTGGGDNAFNISSEEHSTENIKIAPNGFPSLLHSDLSKILGKTEADAETNRIRSETSNPIVDQYVSNHGPLRIDYYSNEGQKTTGPFVNEARNHESKVIQNKLVWFDRDGTLSAPEKTGTVLLSDDFKDFDKKGVDHFMPGFNLSHQERMLYKNIMQTQEDAEKLYVYAVLNSINNGNIEQETGYAPLMKKDFQAAANKIRREKSLGYLTDINGEPLIFMHAGGSGIQRFRKPSDVNAKKADSKTGEEGIYLSRDIEQTKRPGFDKKGNPGEGKDIYYGLVRMRRPYEVGNPAHEKIYKLPKGSETISSDDRKALEAAGFDGVIWDKEGSPKHEVIVFEPDQIETIATYNEGLRSKENENISPEQRAKSDEFNKQEIENQLNNKNNAIQEPSTTEKVSRSGEPGENQPTNSEGVRSSEQRKEITGQGEEKVEGLTPEDRSNLDKLESETGVNFRKIQNLYAKHGEGKPLSEITVEDYQKALLNRERKPPSTPPPIKENTPESASPEGGRPLKVAQRFLESDNYDESFKEGLRARGTTYIPEKTEIMRQEAKAYVDVFDENNELDAAVSNVTDLNNAMKGSVRGTIGAELFQRLLDKSNVEPNESEKEKLKKQAILVASRAAVAYKNAGQEVNSAKIWTKMISNIPEGAIADINEKRKERGLPPLTPEESNLITNLVDTINEANKAQKAYEKLFDSDTATAEEIKDARNKWKDAIREGRKANDKLSEHFREEKGFWETLSTIMQGNLLTPISLLTNVWSNTALQGLRFLKGGIASSLDYILSQGAKLKFMSPRLSEQRTLDVIGRNKGSWKGVAQGTKEGLQQLIDGITAEDLTRRDLHQRLRPAKAWVNLWNTYFKDNKMTAKQQLTAWTEGIFGIPAEAYFRLLNLGDKPFRRMAEMGRLYELADTKGLKGKERARFLEFPDEDTLEEMQKAGDEATFQGTNIPEKSINYTTQLIKKIPFIGGMLGYLTKAIVPFVKTPTNVISETFDYALPPLSLMKSIYYASKGDRRASVDNAAKAIVGSMMLGIAYEIVANGLATGSADNDEEKERSVQYENVPPNSLNIDALTRGLLGQGFEMKDGDTWINYLKTGIPGMIIGMYATMGKDKTQEVFKNLDFAQAFPQASISLIKSSLQQSFLSGMSSILNALVKGGDEAEKLMVNMANTISSTVYPNTVTAASKTSDDYIRSIKDESVWAEIGNMWKQKTFRGDQLPAKITLWGEPVKNAPEGRNKWMYNLFGILKYRDVDTDDFGYKIYNEWVKTKDSQLLPSIPDDQITYQGEKKKLSPKEYEQYLQMVGKARKDLVSYYVNSPQWEDDTSEIRIKMLQDLYSKGQRLGSRIMTENLFE